MNDLKSIMRNFKNSKSTKDFSQKYKLFRGGGKMEEIFRGRGRMEGGGRRRILGGVMEPDLKWQCESCKALLGFMDAERQQVRIKFKDLYVRVSGGTVEVVCRRCGLLNKLTQVEERKKEEVKQETKRVVEEGEQRKKS